MNDLSIIIPAYNEEKSIAKTVNDIIHYMDRAFPKNFDYELIVVDDHSTDKTVNNVPNHSRIKVLPNIRNQGYKNALVQGFRYSQNRYVVFMMADGCDEPATLKHMYAMVSMGYEIVCADRHILSTIYNPDHWLKPYLSKLVGCLCYVLLGVETQDITNSYKMWDRRVLSWILTDTQGGFECHMEWLLNAHQDRYNWKVGSVSSIWIGRQHGESNFKINVQALRYMKVFLAACVKKIIGRRK